MSIKIYSGFRYKGGGGLRQCYERLHALRPQVHKMAVEKHLSFVAEIAKLTFKRKQVTDRAPLYVAMEMWRERTKAVKETGRRDPAVDVEFRVSLYPGSRSIIGIPWIDDHDWMEWFMGQPFIDEYGYWDNTDRPDEISAAAWRERKRRWQQVTEPDATFADIGMEMQLHPGYGPDALALADAARSNTTFSRMILRRCEGMTHEQLTEKPTG